MKRLFWEKTGLPVASQRRLRSWLWDSLPLAFVCREEREWLPLWFFSAPDSDSKQRPRIGSGWVMWPQRGCNVLIDSSSKEGNGLPKLRGDFQKKDCGFWVGQITDIFYWFQTVGRRRCCEEWERNKQGLLALIFYHKTHFWASGITF